MRPAPIWCSSRRASNRLWACGGAQRPSLVSVLTHPGHLGIIPWSVGLTALDLDRGSLGLHRAFVRAHRPVLSVPSRTPGRRHLFWHDDRPRGSRRWGCGRPCLRAGCGCRQLTLPGVPSPLGGEVLGARGYLVMWSGRWVDLLSAAVEGERRMFGPVLEDILLQPDQRRMLSSTDAGLQMRLVDDLASVEVGQRNTALFEALRFWAWPRRAAALTEERVVAVAKTMAGSFASPCPPPRCSAQASRSRIT